MKKIFAYGSLMNTNDLRRTVPNARNLFPVKLYGYKRVFNLKSTYRFDAIANISISVLNLEATSLSEFVNGICFDMDDESFAELLQREKAYNLVETKVCGYFDENRHYQAYFFLSVENQKYSYQLNSDIQANYLKICLDGCIKYGSSFVQDFQKTTHFFGIDESRYEQLIWNQVK